MNEKVKNIFGLKSKYNYKKNDSYSNSSESGGLVKHYFIGNLREKVLLDIELTRYNSEIQRIDLAKKLELPNNATWSEIVNKNELLLKKNGY